MAFIVKEVKNGLFYMQLPNGKVVELKPGMEIPPNATVFGADTNAPTAEIVIGGGNHPIILKGFEVQVFDASMFENMKEVHNNQHINHQNNEMQNVHHNIRNHNTNMHNTHHNNWQPTMAENTNAAQHMATAAGNPAIHMGTDFLQANFENLNLNFNEISPNFTSITPIATTFFNSNSAVVVPVASTPSNVKEFLGVLNNESGIVYEAGLPNGTEAGILPTTVTGNIFSNDTLPVTGATILNVNGVAPNANGIIHIDTNDGNIFELNANTGDYTFTLLHPVKDIVNGVNVNSLTRDFNVNISDNFGHTSTETVAIKIMDDSPTILGNDINVSMDGSNVPHVVADVNIDSQMVKAAASIAGSITPETFNTLKGAFLNDISNIKNTIESIVAVNNENQNYINLLKEYESKIIQYINNIEMKPAGDEVTLVHLDGSTQNYTVQNGDILYDRGDGTYLLVSNVQTHYVNPEALQVIDTKLNNFLDNYSQIIPNADLIKTVANNLLTPDGIDHLKTLISNGEFNIHIIANGMHLANGLLQINTIGVVADIGTQHIVQNVTVADPNHLQHTLTISGNLFDSFGHDGIVYGADGGHIASIAIGNEVYNFDPNNPTQTIHTTNGDMHVNFLTGDVSLAYNGDPNVPNALDIKEPLTITVVDNDGDSVTKNVTLHFGLNENIIELPHHIQNIDLGAGNDTITPVDLAHLPQTLQNVAHLLGVNQVGTDIDFNNVTNVKNIEVINLDKVDNANINNLSLNDVLNVTDNRNHLVIVGDNDSVNQVNTDGWTKVSETHQTIPVDNQGHTAAATTYVYTNGHEYVSLTVNDHIDHTGL